MGRIWIPLDGVYIDRGVLGSDQAQGCILVGAELELSKGARTAGGLGRDRV